MKKTYHHHKKRVTIGITIALLILILTIGICARHYLYMNKPQKQKAECDTTIVVKKNYVYDIPSEGYEISYHSINRGENISSILSEYGITPQKIHDLNEKIQEVYDVRKIRSGQPYAIYTTKDSLHTPHFMVYEIDPVDYMVLGLGDDTSVRRGQKPVCWKKRQIKGKVDPSLWVAMIKCGSSPQLAMILSDIYGWTIDFFGLQNEDEFRVLFEQQYVNKTPLDNFHILAASFACSDSTYYAIPYLQDGEEMYYNEKGKSLEGTFLKAPLDFYRITSKFSNSRFHPVLKRYRPHHGVDYAAPIGTPVYAIGSGKVIAKGYVRGGGHTIKIKHNGTYTTSYMHLSRYAKGLKVGKSVKQKEVIGYVGSTGLSTGPHLDFRIYENGKAVNPLTLKSVPKHPINEAEMPAFTQHCDSLINLLQKI